MPRKLSGEDLHGLLAAVYGPPPWDLTAEGVAAKLSALRQPLVSGEGLSADIKERERKRRALAKPPAVRRPAEDELAHEWLSIHREAAAQKAFRTRLIYLARSAVPVAEASAAVDPPGDLFFIQ